MAEKSQQHGLSSDFHKKNTALIPMLFQKDVHSLKNTLLSSHAHILFAQKHCNLMSRFFNFYMKNPMLSCPYLIKNRSILSKLNCIMDQKSQQDALFFRIFHGKITSLIPIFFQGDVHSRKNTLPSSPDFIKKRPVSQKHGALMSVFQFFYENFPAVKPIFGKKRQFC